MIGRSSYNGPQAGRYAGYNPMPETQAFPQQPLYGPQNSIFRAGQQRTMGRQLDNRTVQRQDKLYLPWQKKAEEPKYPTSEMSLQNFGYSQTEMERPMSGYTHNASSLTEADEEDINKQIEAMKISSQNDEILEQIANAEEELDQINQELEQTKSEIRRKKESIKELKEKNKELQEKTEDELSQLKEEKSKETDLLKELNQLNYAIKELTK